MRRLMMMMLTAFDRCKLLASIDGNLLWLMSGANLGKLAFQLCPFMRTATEKLIYLFRCHHDEAHLWAIPALGLTSSFIPAAGQQLMLAHKKRDNC
jgi:hypothetical protein